LIEKAKLLQAKAGLDSVPLWQLAGIGVVVSAMLIASLSLIANSITIALACYLCVVLQIIDSLRMRIKKLAWQQNLEWPKYLDAIHSAAWAGSSLQQAILDCRNFAPKGTGWAITELEQDLASGLTFETSMMNLKARLGSPIADRFIEITRLAHLAGGKGYLAALRSQALQLRLENATWQEIDMRQSWVIASARLAVFAPWLVLLLLSMRAETARVFASGSGLLILATGLVATVGAFQLIRFLARLPKRQRVLGGL